MFRRRRSRLDEEVETHLAEEIAENLARGMDPDAARAAALRAFGNVEAAKETVRERDRLYWLDTLGQDVRFAFRLMARNRWLSATIVATLTVGIALNVSVFSLLNSFLMKPWVRSEPETIVAVRHRYSGNYNLRYSEGGISQPDYARYRDSATSLTALSAHYRARLTLGGPASGTIQGGLVSCNITDVLRPAPAILGRYLNADECADGNPAQVMVLSETAWRTRFNGDSGIVGRTVLVNRVPLHGSGGCAESGVPRPRQRLRSVGAVQHARAAAPDQRFLQRCPCPMARADEAVVAPTSRCGRWRKNSGCWPVARIPTCRAGRPR